MQTTNPAMLPTLMSYRQQQQARRKAILKQAYRDGTYGGFALGVLVSLAAWLVLSGTLLHAVMWAAWAWLTLVYGRAW